MNILGTRIKERREAKSWTQDQLAQEIGASRSTIGDYETGRKAPRYDRLNLIADKLGTSTDYLLGRIDDPMPIAEENLDLIEAIEHKKPHIRGVPVTPQQARMFRHVLESFYQDLLDEEQKKD